MCLVFTAQLAVQNGTITMKKVTVDSYDELLQLLDKVNRNEIKKTLLLFTGSKASNGLSWCPDCNDADPVIKQCLATYEETQPADAAQTLFVTVVVGERDA